MNEEQKEIYERVKNSVGSKRADFVRKRTALITIPLLIIFAIIAYIAEKSFGISGYIGCAIASIAAYTIGFIVSEKQARKRFSEYDDQVEIGVKNKRIYIGVGLLFIVLGGLAYSVNDKPGVSDYSYQIPSPLRFETAN